MHTKTQHQNQTQASILSPPESQALVTPAESQNHGNMFGLRLTFHCLGISCLAGAVALQLLVFLDIAFQGFFMGVEQNLLILNAEIAITFFGVFYLLYLSISKIRSILNSRIN